VGAVFYRLTPEHSADTIKPTPELTGSRMADIERTNAGFQTVIPGCERRTLPKSTSSADDTGQGLLGFYRPPSLREKLTALAEAPMQPRRSQRR